MNPSAPRPAGAARIIGAMEQRQTDLVERCLSRIVDEIAFYADTDVIAREETRKALRSNLAYIIRNLDGDGDLDLHAPEATGRRRAAQGVPLVDLVAAYRLAFSEIWAEAVAVAGRVPGASADDLVGIAGRLFELHERYTGAAVAGYRAEARELLRTAERERSVLVEVVVAGTATTGELWQAARSLGLPVAGRFLVAAAATNEPGHDPLPRIESALAAIDVGSVWRLEASVCVGVLGGVTPERESVALELLGRLAPGRVGASPAFTDLTQAAHARRLAQLALDTNRLAQGVRQYPNRPIDVLVAADPGTAVAVARSVLGGVLDLPGEDRDQLLGTLDAWVTAKGSAKDAGAALFCHPNTVRYRLRRIESLTGRELHDPAGVAELVAAARAWSQLPHPTV